MKNSDYRTAERLWRVWWSGAGASGDPLEPFREIALSGVPDAEFKKGRRLFLCSILGREHIFSTGTFRARYERAAGENITAPAVQYDEGIKPRRSRPN